MIGFARAILSARARIKFNVLLLLCVQAALFLLKAQACLRTGRLQRQATAWLPRHKSHPDRRGIEAYVSQLQTTEWVRTLEDRRYTSSTALGKFADGTYFIWLCVNADLCVTPAAFLKGTRFEDMPLHITLGARAQPGSEAEIAQLVEGQYTFTLQKWSRRRESTTYRPLGALYQLCERCRGLGFTPRGD